MTVLMILGLVSLAGGLGYMIGRFDGFMAGFNEAVDQEELFLDELARSTRGADVEEERIDPK